MELDEPILEVIEDHYFRYLGVRGATEFYMARTDHADTVTQGLCFIAVDTETNETTSKCQDPDELDPMVIHIDTPDEAFLIPDDTHIEDLPEGWSQTRRNVVVVTEPDTAPDEAEVLLPSSDMPTKLPLKPPNEVDGHRERAVKEGRISQFLSLTQSDSGSKDNKTGR